MSTKTYKHEKFYIYDLHTLSLIYDLRNTIKKTYEVIKINSLNQISDEEAIVEITPLCIDNEQHWNGIKTFLSTHTKQKVIMLVQDQCKQKVEETVGHHNNVIIFDMNNVINLDAIIEEIMK